MGQERMKLEKSAAERPRLSVSTAEIERPFSIYLFQINSLQKLIEFGPRVGSPAYTDSSIIGSVEFRSHRGENAMYLADKFGDRWILIVAVALPILLVIVLMALFQLVGPTGI